jgi:prepilin-type N-terminal cleavage/methylation domain-containing protein
VRYSRIQPRAFTLMELILVMTIIVIATAMVAPSMVSFAAGRDNSNTATLIVSLANYARTQSISQGRTYRLNVDPGKGLIFLTAGSAGVFSEMNDDFGQEFPISSGAKMETDIKPATDGQYVEFDSNGRCEPGKIWLTDRYGRTIEVACDSPTELFRIVPAAEMSR